jgi:starch synthase
MAYGTLPIVRGVGGLRDSVNDYDQDASVATGFVFEQPDPRELLNVLQRSLLLYSQQPNEVKRVQLYAMEQNFCWSKAADEYINLYHQAINA